MTNDRFKIQCHVCELMFDHFINFKKFNTFDMINHQKSKTCLLTKKKNFFNQIKSKFFRVNTI